MIAPPGGEVLVFDTVVIFFRSSQEGDQSW